MEKRNVLVDVDDTINRMQVSLLQYVNSRIAVPFRYHQLTSAERESQNETLDGLVQEFLGQPNIVIKSYPFSRALEAVELLHRQGFGVHITSSRKEPLHQATIDWLEKHGFTPYIADVHPRSSLIPGHEFKIAVARKIDAATAFDDTKSIAEALSQNEICVYLIRRPWNRELTRSQFMRPHPSFYRAVLAFLKDHE